jgi:thiaminase/transcriptional activator TenA
MREIDLNIINFDNKTAEQLKSELVEEYETGKGFAGKLRREFDYIYKKIENNPFLAEIEEGKLPLEKIRKYAVQNSFYVYEWLRCLGSAMAHSNPTSNVLIFSRLVQLIPYSVDRICFMKIMKEVGIKEEQLDDAIENSAIPLYASRAYIDHMYNMFSIESPGVLIASFISCPWSYTERELGGCGCARRIAEGLGKFYGASEENVEGYRLEEGFSEWHMQFLKICKEVINFDARTNPEGQKRLRDAFHRGAEHEYLFWDQAYSKVVELPRFTP